MRVTLQTFIGFVAFFGLSRGLSDPNEPYNSVCNPPPSGEQELEPGLMVRYECGRGLFREDYTGIYNPAATPRDCAIACSRRSVEALCSWQDGHCFEYNAGRSPGQVTGSITIYTSHQPEIDPEPEPTRPIACEEERTELQSALSTCKSNVTTLERRLTFNYRDLPSWACRSDLTDPCKPDDSPE